MGATEVFVNAEMAAVLLNRNTNNRRLNNDRVKSFMTEMVGGVWKYNGDTVRISKTGVLLDGQHRLAAIEKAGNIRIKMLIVDNLDDEVFTTIDIGQARTAGQMVSMAGKKNGNVLASCAKMYLTWYNTGKPVHGSFDKRPAHHQIVWACSHYASIQSACAEVVKSKWLKKYLSLSVAAFCYTVFADHDQSACENFFIEIAGGNYSYTDSPAKILREFLIENKNSLKKPDRITMTAYVFKCFQLYTRNKKMKMLRLGNDQNAWFKL